MRGSCITVKWRHAESLARLNPRRQRAAALQDASRDRGRIRTGVSLVERGSPLPLSFQPGCWDTQAGRRDPRRQGAAALQDASRDRGHIRMGANLVECGCPLPLSFQLGCWDTQAGRRDPRRQGAAALQDASRDRGGIRTGASLVEYGCPLPLSLQPGCWDAQAGRRDPRRQGLPHSKTLRATGGAFEPASASWSAAVLCRFPFSLDAGIRRLSGVIQGGRGLPHSKTLRATEGTSEWAPASWSAAVLCRFPFSLDAGIRRLSGVIQGGRGCLPAAAAQAGRSARRFARSEGVSEWASASELLARFGWLSVPQGSPGASGTPPPHKDRTQPGTPPVQEPAQQSPRTGKARRKCRRWNIHQHS